MKLRLLDLFCGAGGAAMGYHRAGFEVVGVDINPQKHYPFEFHQADAMAYPLDSFDVIHASPPCQAYSECTPKNYRSNHPDLIKATRDLLQSSGKPYIIENVDGARRLLKNKIMLCGSMFGLKIYRHRWFELHPVSLFNLTPACQHSFVPVVPSGHTNRKDESGKRMRSNHVNESREAMGIDWMTSDRLTLAIPPAYTEFIGKQLMEYLRQSVLDM